MSATPSLTLDGLSVHRRGAVVVDGVTLSLRPGAVTGLIGPNGAGKTTLMRAALGFLPHTGQSSLSGLPPRDRARLAAWLPQTREIAWPVTVARLVLLGRVPHLAGGAKPSEADHAATARALTAMGLGGFEQRKATDLSGGEQARVLIARLLAQEAPLILADEPIAGLDPLHQHGAMAAFTARARAGATVLVSLHDLGLAAQSCDRLILMHRGKIAADGPPEAVLTGETMAEVFGIATHITQGPKGLMLQPLGAA